VLPVTVVWAILSNNVVAGVSVLLALVAVMLWTRDRHYD
jgi:hypothetical protein